MIDFLWKKKQQKNLITELRKFNLNSIEKFNFNSDPFDYLESVKLLRIKETQEKERKKNYFVINNGITKNTLNRTETVIEKKNSSQSPLNCEWEKDSFKILFCVLLVCVNFTVVCNLHWGKFWTFYEPLHSFWLD